MFKTNKNKDLNAYDKGKKTSAAEYNIHIYEALGNTPRKIKTFTAKRWVDEDDLIPYLYYKDEKNKVEWLEVFPEKVKDFVKESKQDIEKKLEKKYKQLEEEKKKEVPEVNFKDIEYEIMKCQAKLRTFNYSHNTSYISLDENNVPEFFFKREGSTYHPFKWDLDTSTIYTPSDNKKKSATIALRNKETKYNSTPISHKILSMVFLGIALIAMLGSGWIMYKSVDSYSESEINQAISACMQNYNQIVSNTQEQSESISNIINNLEDRIVIEESDTSDNDPPEQFE